MIIIMIILRNLGDFLELDGQSCVEILESRLLGQ